MKRHILLNILLFIIGGVNAQIHILENKDILAKIDLSNASLTQFYDKESGWEIIPDKNFINSFEMNIKQEKGGGFHATGANQPKPEIEITKNKLTFTWYNIQNNDKKLNITFTGIIKLTEEGLIYEGKIENGSNNIVEELAWPCIKDVSMPQNSQKFLFQYLNYSRFNITELYPQMNGSYRSWCNLPEASFVLLNNEKQGLYLSSKDYKLDEFIRCEYELLPREEFAQTAGQIFSKKNNEERDQMRLQIKAARMIYTQPQDSTNLVSFIMKPYVGSWHKAADIYKEWRKTWHKAPHRAQWIKDVNSWRQIQINGSESNLNFTYKDLIEYAKECKQYGVNAIQLTGWTLGGQDNGVPSHDIDPRLGTYDEFKNAIAQSQKIGINILLFTKLTWIDLTADYYDKFKDYVAINSNRDSCWHPGYNYSTYTQLMGISTHRFGVLCMMDKNCRKALCDEFQKCLDLGANGMVYDENQHHAGHTLCFNPNHSHKIPGFLFQGADLLGADYHRMIQQHPDFVMSGEAPYDIQSQYYITYTRADPGHIPVMRYIDSENPIACAVLSHNDKNKINMCLMDRYSICYEPRNFKGKLSEFPRLMEYGQKVDQLRKKYADYVWNAEFRDTLGATCNGDNILHSVFIRRDNNKKAVVVVNTNTRTSSKATVKLDNLNTNLVYVTPEHQEPQMFAGSIELAPQSAAIIFEK